MRLHVKIGPGLVIGVAVKMKALKTRTSLVTWKPAIVSTESISIAAAIHKKKQLIHVKEASLPASLN